ncbi:MAG: tetratricopeptide repeat protein [Calditrichaeota bacterium]|jgi:Ca-activated chloride channel homolog|nr:tetratricopeptide repeat protein [Calditrichota bacterium]MBT7619007.1 tetratricopeptide repeat protein [Calditrichota bacterium]MBT7789938.1 tetratricopeptide repeat protein [Calditrichota bacterium]
MGRLLLIVLFAFLTFSTVLAEKPREAVRKGIDLYHDKEYDRALAEFMAARQDAPDREELDYDLGAALYKLEKYPEAMGAFAKVLEKEEPELAADAWYNLGNTLARSEKFEESLGAFKNSLRLRSDDEDTKYNLETVLKMMQMQQQQQQQQQEGGEQDSTQQQEKQDQQEQQKQEQNEEQKEEEQQQQQEQEEQSPPDSTQQAQPQEEENESEMTEEEAMQLLQAMENEELEAMKEKLKRQFGKPKRAEKDW